MVLFTDHTKPLESQIGMNRLRMRFFGTVGHGGAPHHNFVVIALMTMKFGTGIKLDVDIV